MISPTPAASTLPLEPRDMGGDRGPGTADLIVYIDRSDIRRGRFGDLKDGIRRLVEFIESREPQLIAYSFHLDEETTRMTVVAVHPDSASLEQKAKMLGGDGVTVHERFAGFARPPTARD